MQDSDAVAETIAELRNEISILSRRIEMLEGEYHWQKRRSWREKFRPKLWNFHQYEPRKLRTPNSYREATSTNHDLRFAIVTPSYNHGRFIKETIDSVLQQNYPNIDYIVQDGASKDNTREILQSFGDRLKWTSEPDGGQTDAINRGFQVVSGDIMGYLNSDDLLLPGALNYVAEAFRRHADIDFVYGNRIVINEGSKETARIILPPHDHEAIVWADYIPQETMFWRRRVWDRIGPFDTTFNYAMDWDYILRARAAGFTFKRLPRFLGCFRVHDSQKTFAMQKVGEVEQTRLRKRSLNRVPAPRDINRAISFYLKKEVFFHRLYKLGFLKV